MDTVAVAGVFGFDPTGVCHELAQHGVASRAVQIDSRVPSTAGDDTRAAVLVVPRPGPATLGEHVMLARQHLPVEASLLLCAPRVSPSDARALAEYGVTRMVTPAGWDVPAVSERVLAEFILRGDVEPAGLGTLRGATLPMRTLYDQIKRLALLSEPVLIVGATGTGKELVARELHARSEREMSLLPINCAALTPELVESELFGHERGAFSSAVTKRRGLLVEAGSGTVFLDEIGELTPASQAKLLRVIEERSVRPVGSNQFHPVHARLIFATNVDLEAAVRERRFRHDLFERIRGVTLRVPPLSQRKADIPLLVHHFLDQFNREYPGARTVPDGALDPLFHHEWPGNVRELRGALRQAAIYAEGDAGSISTLHLIEVARAAGPRVESSSVVFDPMVESWHDVHGRVRTAYFRAVFRQTGGDIDAIAKRTGLSRSQIYEIRKQIERPAGDNEMPADP